jgi:hypothetical protein
MLTSTPSGDHLVRILDFGIAQSLRESAGGAQDELAMGTVCYMAPEQIRPGRVDAMADIWSLGVVLYEMLSGRLPFERASAHETLDAVAGPAPADFSVLPPEVPSSLVAVLRRTLDKDVGRQYQSARQLVAISNGLQPRAVQDRLKTLAARFWSEAHCGPARVCGECFRSTIWTRRRSHPRNAFSNAVHLLSGYEQNPAISPDGRQIAYVGQGVHGTNPLELYVQAIGSDPVRLTHNGPGELQPGLGPHGPSVAVLRTVAGTPFARVLLIPTLAGTASDLGVDRILWTGHLDWSPDGTKLAFTRLHGSDQGVIYEWSIKDRTLRQVSFPRAGQTDCCPEFNFDGRRLAFKRNEGEIGVVDEPTGVARSLPARVSWPGLAWSADGKSRCFSWFGRMGEVDLSGATLRRPATIRYDIMDVPCGKQMACVRWEFDTAFGPWNSTPVRSRVVGGRHNSWLRRPGTTGPNFRPTESGSPSHPGVPAPLRFGSPAPTASTSGD